MPSAEAKVFNEMLKKAIGGGPGLAEDPQAIRERNAARKAPPLPEGVSLEYLSLDGVHAERFVKDGNTKGWVFYIHGGGFAAGSARERRGITQYITANFGYNCVSIDYRLAPENRWPAQIDDCFAAYRAFTVQCQDPENIVLMGESAGGMLSLSLALLLKKRAEELPGAEKIPMPKAIVSLSSCVTHAEHFPSHSENIGKDIILGDLILKGMWQMLFGEDIDPDILRDPIVSPLYGDYTGLPPVFISCTDAETLYDDSVELYKKLKEAGHAAAFDMQEGCCHAYQINPGMIPEAAETLKKAFAFIDSPAV